MSLTETFYLANVTRDTVYFISPTGEFKNFQVDNVESIFKQSLMNDNYKEAGKVLQGTKLCSRSIMEYVYSKGNVDPMFISDLPLRFDLSIRSGDIKIAYQTAKKLNETKYWDIIAQHALLQGHFKMYEKSLLKSLNTTKLSFYYLISGQINKLNSLDCDPNLVLQRSIWTNDKTISSITSSRCCFVSCYCCCFIV